MEKTMQDKETKEKNLYSDLQRRMLEKDVKQRMENKMQDSQKAKDELWNRLWKEFGQLVYMEGMNEHVKEGANGDLVDFIASELDKAREEGRRELLDSIIEGVTQLKDLVSMFNPMSPEIRAKQSGEIEAYNGLLEKLSKLITK